MSVLKQMGEINRALDFLRSVELIFLQIPQTFNYRIIILLVLPLKALYISVPTQFGSAHIHGKHRIR